MEAEEAIVESRRLNFCMDNLVFDWIPKIGVEFDTIDDARTFYTIYGGKTGFNVRQCYFNRNKKQQISTIRFVCSKEGIRAKDKRDAMTRHPRVETRINCQILEDPDEIEFFQTQGSLSKFLQDSVEPKTKLIIKDLSDVEFMKSVLTLFDPKISHHIIDRIEDVRPDGHCGYRCCAEHLGLCRDNGWIMVRKRMLVELHDHIKLHELMMADDYYVKMKKALDYFKSPAPKKYWMEFS